MGTGLTCINLCVDVRMVPSCTCLEACDVEADDIFESAGTWADPEAVLGGGNYPVGGQIMTLHSRAVSCVCRMLDATCHEPWVQCDSRAPAVRMARPLHQQPHANAACTSLGLVRQRASDVLRCVRRWSSTRRIASDDQSIRGETVGISAMLHRWLHSRRHDRQHVEYDDPELADAACCYGVCRMR